MPGVVGIKDVGHHRVGLAVMSDADRLDPVRRYYQERGESELHRLDNPYEGVIERELHRRVFEELIPTGARVLDLGGGPGQWTAWLLERGHHVVLADLSPTMLAIARRELRARGLQADGVVEVDARDLSRFADGEFDVVLALGPFYHLIEVVDRTEALEEARRVLRPGGLLLATVMTRYPWTLAALLEGGPGRVEVASQALADGVYRHPEDGRFTEAYLFRVEEVPGFFESAGFTTQRLMASQGMLHLVQEQVAGLWERDAAAYDALIEMAYRSSGDTSILGISNHLLYAGVAG